MGCDGIYDRLNNMDIFNLVWGFKNKDEVFKNYHLFYGNCADAVIKYSLKKLTADNVTVIFIAFKNFESKMTDENFYYGFWDNICRYDESEIDLAD